MDIDAYAIALELYQWAAYEFKCNNNKIKATKLLKLAKKYEKIFLEND